MGRAPLARAGDDLAELDDTVAAARVELGRAGGKRCESGVALLDGDEVGAGDDLGVELGAAMP